MVYPRFYIRKVQLSDDRIVWVVHERMLRECKQPLNGDKFIRMFRKRRAARLFRTDITALFERDYDKY